MALSTNKLYYRRGGTTYSCNLYTSTSDVGSTYMSVYIGGSTQYVPLGSTSDSRASYLRVQKGGTIYAVLNSIIAYVGAWTLVATKTGSGTTYYSITTNYNRIFSSSLPYNAMVSANTLAYFIVNGTSYNMAESGNPTYFRFYQATNTIGLSTGSTKVTEYLYIIPA